MQRDDIVRAIVEIGEYGSLNGPVRVGEDGEINPSTSLARISGGDIIAVPAPE